MSRVEQKVQVFSIGFPREGLPREKRRHRVKWRIDGQDKTRSLKTKAEAERLQARLQMAVIEGEEFDLITGLRSPGSRATRPGGTGRRSGSI